MVYEVKSPILGLEQIKKVEFSEIDDYFVLVKGLDEDGQFNGIELRLINPYALRQDYSFDIPVAIQSLMEIHKDSRLRTYCLVIFQEPIENSQVVFIAPLVFNEDNQTVMQIELNRKEYPHFGIAESLRHYHRSYISDEPTIYELKSPILGFDSTAKIALTKRDDNFITVNIRGQKSDGSDSGFEMTLVNPYIRRDYAINVPDNVRNMLNIRDDSDVLIYCPLVIQNPIENSLVNFLGPIVFNIENHTAAQVVLQPTDYPAFGTSEPIKKFVSYAL
ncbi:MAG: flagellar assembly protein FliW [Helicobacter sp.]|nr:flagellar assembly protein FliW [Helicobacter sp.]MDE6045378.1 flagellar assembly protein FliW [Helicobacter sp.]MDE7196035.1 flagellar assembly protein FliW [Helicobacter sp.]